MTRERSLHASLFEDPEVASQLSDEARIRAMLAFEVALARAEAKVGIVPETYVHTIEQAARSGTYTASDLEPGARASGTPALPLVERLMEQVSLLDPAAASYVHLGATSQDLLDSSLVLQLARAAGPTLALLDRCMESCARLAEQHASTPMSGRTWLQHATPISFGLKAAGWLDALLRGRRRLASAFERMQVLQLGGASGTLAALGEHGPEVVAAMAADLELQVALLPWHTQRDRLAELACSLAIAVGSSGKIARDLALMSQTEIAEIAPAIHSEVGSSSTMPQKHNPVACALILAAATRAPALVATLLSALPQEHERALGGWQAEWETLPDLVALSAGTFRSLASALDSVEVDAERMRFNLQQTSGRICAEAVSMALSPHLGRSAAHAHLAKACRQSELERRSLLDVLLHDEVVTRHLDLPTLEQLLHPENYLGATHTFIERAVSAWQLERRSNG